MFLWEWAFGEVMDALADWVYTTLVGLLGAALSLVGNMGYELLELTTVKGILNFFTLLGWALYVTGMVVSVFEAGIDYQSGRGNLKDTAMGALKGFLAASLFTIVPVRLFKLTITLQTTIAADITHLGSGTWVELIKGILDPFTSAATVADLKAELGTFGGRAPDVFYIFFLIMILYAFIKVFFASIKRGGILLIQMAVGSLYMFSIPRGYTDSFYNWCKQVAGICLTSFLQVTVLTAGCLILKAHPLLGWGLMLSATEVPRIAGHFGLDTTMRTNMIGAVHGAQMAVGAVKAIGKAAA